MNKERLKEYIDSGFSQRKIAKLENISQTGLRYWLNKYELRTKKIRSSWTDEELIEAIRSSEFMSDAIIKLGLKVRPGNYDTMKRHVRRLNLDTSHFIGNGSRNSRGGPTPVSNEAIFCDNSLHGRSTAKSRLIKQKIIPYRCSICDIDEWRGKRLSLVLDHINGINNDHRLINLRFLCPNCNSLQLTFCRKN